ncbi:unnamed protein product [Arabis nemorensis]|uniref:Uncharacterized protein n=1 Tax=Arabis nemorensis TaxID=586526 RepID=A0A565B9F2_9BRAS|nr:unnamed protein product [Arabis nemorensis]
MRLSPRNHGKWHQYMQGSIANLIPHECKACESNERSKKGCSVVHNSRCTNGCVIWPRCFIIARWCSEIGREAARESEEV